MNERIIWPDRVAAWIAQNHDELTVGVLVALALVAIMLVLRNVGERIVARNPGGTSWRAVVGRVFAKTGLAFMVIAAADIVGSYTEPPAQVGRILSVAFVIAAALQAAVWGRELIMGIVGRHAGDEVGETALDNARAVIRVLVSVALFAIAAVVILDNLGVNVTALVAGLGIGGIAIGFAAQGIFSDLFAALSILFDKPFRRGDTIRYDDSVGTVERIGLKTTRLRSLTGEGLVMSNKNLLDKEIHNFAEGHSRRTTFGFNIVYQTDPEKLKQIPDIAAGVVKSRSGCKFVRCAITALGPSSIDYELIFDSATVDPDVLGADRTAIVVELVRAFALHRIEFAYPTQTTFTAAPDGTMIMPYSTQSPTPARANRKS
jgi:small-conductance mechanosensitive channel